MTRDPWTERRSGAVRHSDDARSDYEVDYARIIHSSSFRRLQGKTQILALGDDDFYRTRLTHSLEVAQVAEGIVQQLRRQPLEEAAVAALPSSALVEAIGLAHDIGHPPFGHGGEMALNYCMRDAGGFEGNGQTLRILSRLESFSEHHGADLTRRALLGVLKYPVRRSAALDPALQPALEANASTIAVLGRTSSHPVKAYYDREEDVVEWILEPFGWSDRTRFQEHAARPGRHAKALHKSFACSIMDLADDIAYGVHDLEDAIALRLIDEKGFRGSMGRDRCPALIDALEARPLDGSAPDVYETLVAWLFGDAGRRKRAIGRMVHVFLRGVHVARDHGFEAPELAFRAALTSPLRTLLDELQSLIATQVIDSPRVQQLEFKGQRMVVAVFEALCTDPGRLLPAQTRDAYRDGGADVRVICDYVAGMTDGALLKTFERLFSPRMGSLFDPL